MDAEYLKATVGPALAEGLAHTVIASPDDPVEFLAHYLLKHADIQEEGKSEKIKMQEAEAERLKKLELERMKLKEEEQSMTNAQLQKEKEEKRLRNILQSADQCDRVYDAILAFIRQRTGASAYIGLADQPEKPEEGAEGEEPPPEEPPPEEGEGDGVPKPKYIPQRLEYVAATLNDVPLMVGKVLERPQPTKNEDDEEVPPVRGVNEGVSFDAIDSLLYGKSQYLHVTSAVENMSVKFFYIPRRGAYLCVPFMEPGTGLLKGILGLDTLGLHRAFSDAEIKLVLELVESMANAIARIEKETAEREAAERAEMQAAYENAQAELAKELEEAGEDTMAAGKAKMKRACADLLALDKNKLAEVKGYKVVKEEIVKVVKAVMYLLGHKKMGEWEDMKKDLGRKLPWGGDLLDKINSFDPTVETQESRYTNATKQLAELDATRLKQVSFVAFLLFEWASAAIALYTEKAAQEKAEKEAAEAAAAEGGAAE